MGCTPSRRPNKGVGLAATPFTRGVIPQKLSDLENDLGYVTLKELADLLGGEGSDNPLLLNLTEGLTADQIAQIKINLRIFDFKAETKEISDDDWSSGYVDDPNTPNWVEFKNEEGVSITEAIGGEMLIKSITFDLNKFNKQVTFMGDWSGGEQTAKLNWKERDEVNGYRIEGLNGLCFWIGLNVEQTVLTLYLSDAANTNKREEKGTFTKKED